MLSNYSVGGKIKFIISAALFLSLSVANCYSSDATTLKTLNNLIEALQHDENGYSTAAESVDNEIQKTTFNAFAMKRAQLREELQKKAKELGADLGNLPSPSQKVASDGWQAIKATANNKDQPAIFEILKNGEKGTQKIYEE